MMRYLAWINHSKGEYNIYIYNTITHVDFAEKNTIKHQQIMFGFTSEIEDLTLNMRT